jgi:hypothetical protein
MDKNKIFNNTLKLNDTNRIKILDDLIKMLYWNQKHSKYNIELLGQVMTEEEFVQSELNISKEILGAIKSLKIIDNREGLTKKNTTKALKDLKPFFKMIFDRYNYITISMWDENDFLKWKEELIK